MADGMKAWGSRNSKKYPYLKSIENNCGNVEANICKLYLKEQHNLCLCNLQSLTPEFKSEDIVIGVEDWKFTLFFF